MAVCLFAASATKLRHRTLFGESLAGAGLPRRAIKFLSLAVPIAELLSAVLMVIPATARLGALFAIVLLASFTAYIGRLLAQHNVVPCNCFVVRADAAPVGWWAVARNVFLLSCALVAALTRNYRGIGGVRTHPVDLALGVLGATCVVLIAICFSLLRRYGNARTQLAHLQSIVEAASAADSEQSSASFHVEYPLTGANLPSIVSQAAKLIPGTPHLLLFLSTDCAACQDVLRALADITAARFADLGGRLILSGPMDELESRVAVSGPRFIHDANGALAAAAQLPGVPCALVVGVNRTIDQFVAGAPEIISLFDDPTMNPADFYTTRHHPNKHYNTPLDPPLDGAATYEGVGSND